MRTQRELAIVLICVLALVACHAPRPRLSNYTDEAELGSLELVAERVLHLRFDGAVRRQADARAVGMLSKSVLLSRRINSRTYFVFDQRAGFGGGTGSFAGTDEAMLSEARRILDGLDIPRAEISRPRVLRETLQEVSRDPDSPELAVGKPYVGGRLVVVSRRLEGLPVFSSHLKLSLSKQGEIGFMELHWPDVSEAARSEAHRLAYKVDHGWKAPELAGATVESVEAGILHSPALGVLLEMQPAIRVIYAPTGQAIGKKAVRYLDRAGSPIAMPRSVELPCPPAGKARYRPQDR